MFLPMILTRCMAHRFIPTLPFTIRLPAITRREWRSHLESDSLLERLGAAVGAGGAGGAATTTSTSTTTIISFGTRILTAATATTSVTGTPTGSTIRSIAAALRIATKLRQTGLAVRHAETLWPTVRLRPGTRLAGRAAIWPAIAPKELAEAIEAAMELVRAIGPAMELVRAIGPAGRVPTA